MEKLAKLIKNKKAKVAILGLGYVGLPPSSVGGKKNGFFVSRIDIQMQKIF